MGLVFFFHVGQPRTPIIDEALDRRWMRRRDGGPIA